MHLFCDTSIFRPCNGDKGCGYKYGHIRFAKLPVMHATQAAQELELLSTKVPNSSEYHSRYKEHDVEGQN